MSRFERKLKKEIRSSENTVPDEIKNSINKTLNSLPEKEIKKHPAMRWRPVLTTAVALAAVCFLVLPNISANIAYAMEEIPVIGKFIKVITIRNYIYKDEYHDMQAEIPSIDFEGESDVSGSAADYINASVKELTNTLLDAFYADVDSLGDQAHSALKIDYEVKTNNDKWFTLKLNIHEATGSGNSYYKLYHIDKQTGETAQLSNLFVDGCDYISLISEEIQKQMIMQMKNDNSVVYWLDAEYPEWNFSKIQENQNFYFTENGNIVIVFDKYEVGPGSTGTPEFEIPKEIYESCLKEHLKNS